MISVVQKSRLKSRLNNFYGANSSSGFEDGESFSKLLAQVAEGKALDDQLSLAGFVTSLEQSRVGKLKVFLISISLFLALVYGISQGKSLVSIFVILFVSLYLAYFLFTFYMRIKKTESLRDAYFDTPLVIEEVILLIESGLALFPAIEKVCTSGKGRFSKSIVRKYLKMVYQLTIGGIPMSEAFLHVSNICPFPPIRSMLVHFDVSCNVGGELLHSLQALAIQVHNEWKVSVETRVKKLENLVVFPVFIAVIGMMILVAAVPMVPILQFMDSIKNTQKDAVSVVSFDQSKNQEGLR